MASERATSPDHGRIAIALVTAVATGPLLFAGKAARADAPAPTTAEASPLASNAARAAESAAPPTGSAANPPIESRTLPVTAAPIYRGLPRRHHGTTLRWDPEFNRVDAPELTLTGVSFSIAIATAIAPPLSTGWHGASSFGPDESVRNALRLGNYVDRQYARDVSDVLLSVETTFPFMVDSLMVAYWYRGSADVATQMTLIDIEAMSVTAALQGAANFFGGRERPYGRDCGGSVPSNTIDCATNQRYRSFFSGHTSLSFTTAGLVCSHHLRLHLFESDADAITCVTALAAAAATGTLRIVGDQHYLTDVLTGALVGAAVGFGFPLLHHYRVSARDEGPHLRVMLAPTVNGIMALGEF
jgi:hypothetical protein